MPAKVVEVFTDGSSSGNPGPGGYGIVMRYGAHQKEFSKGFRKTTNNRMELLAVIDALKKLKKAPMSVKIYSDSKYVVDSVEKGWVFGWEKKNFAKKKNPDLWQEFLKEYRKHKVVFEWVKGHAGHRENERCDELAVHAGQHPEFVDEYFENQ